ncbi:hypothetical protein GTH32_05865 [Alteromonas sp. 345S023]|uniref:Uncharacterized protein n=1 Tax=Alteromonas profundi TaxID=2696062 RepID=A0A7X5RK80_9ALTE|nr:hypothetical protein [Alteromonas profundi]NDV90723.1 hypothetical protein [Alteromonas profundi]
MLTYAAGGLTLAALMTVYRSWRVQSAGVFYFGVVLWVFACIWWSYAQGWEFGVLYGLCLPACLVWPFILKNQSYLPKSTRIPSPRKLDFSTKTLVTHIGHFVVVMGVLMAASVSITLAVCALLPFSLTGQLAIAIVLLPILWGLAAYHYLAAANKVAALSVYLVALVIGIIVLTFVPMSQ